MKNLKSEAVKKSSIIISTDTIRKKMGEVLDSVYFRGDEYIIERKHKKLAALVPIEKYNALNKLARQIVLDKLITLHNTGIHKNDADAIADEVKHLVRKNQ